MAGRTDGAEHARLAATRRACRALRHDLATPLSAGLLHLELAARAVQRAPEAFPEPFRTALQTGRLQMDYAARLLDVLGEMGREGDEPVTTLDLGETAARSLASLAGELAARSLSARLSRPERSVTFTGRREGCERSLRELLLGLASVAEPGDMAIDVEEDGDAGARLSIRMAPKAPMTPELLFKLSRRADDGSSPAAAGLFLARWFLEGEGGRIESRAEPGCLLVTLILPRGAA